jgi:hypothetical protein
MSEPSISQREDNVALALNPRLDRLQLAETFHRNGRVHIPSILTDVTATRLHYALEQETPWGLIFNEGKVAREYKMVTPKKHQKMVLAAWERAHMNFQYIYQFYRLSEGQKIFPPPTTISTVWLPFWALRTCALLSMMLLEWT